MSSRQSAGNQRPARSNDRYSNAKPATKKYEEPRQYTHSSAPRSNGAPHTNRTTDTRSTMPRMSNPRAAPRVTVATEISRSSKDRAKPGARTSPALDNDAPPANHVTVGSNQSNARSSGTQNSVWSRSSDSGREFSPEPTTSVWDDPYNNVSISEENRLTREFMDRTNASDFQLINDILAGTKWNVDDAVQAYRQIQADEEPRKESDQTISSRSQSDMQPHHSSQAHGGSSNSYTSIDKERRLLRGLSKVYDMRDGAESMEMDKINILNASSDPNLQSKQLNINISLDNTYLLPDLTGLSPELADYIEHELIDFVTMNVLERTGHINWWAKHSLSRRLWPLHTTGDGNCLLHAASLGMWGVQDRHLHLRVKLHRFLAKQTKQGALYRRWRWQQTQSNMEMGLIFTEEEWQNEWQDLVSLSSASTKVIREDDQVLECLEFLEEFHVYVLAQIIGRPIIVFADSVMRDVDGYPLSPVPFGGIYLPMECNVEDCFKSPLLLAYDRSHFTAVVTMSPSKSKKEHNPMRDLVPLTGPECDLVPMHFFVDPGAKVNWSNLSEDRCTMMNVITCIQDYMEVRHIPLDQVQAGTVIDDGSLSNSGSTSSLNGKDQKTGMMDKARTILFNKNNSRSSSKVKETKNAPSDLELEPGNELIMCAKLTVKTPKAYLKDMEKYLELTKREYEDKKARNLLRDPKTIPLIATKDYAKNLSLQPTELGKSNLSAPAMSPSSSMCRKCAEYLGTVEQDNLCSACYRESESGRPLSDMCRRCHKSRGMKENYYYCPQCYKDILEGTDADEDRQTNNSNIAESGDRKLAEKFAIQMSKEDPANDERFYGMYNNNRNSSGEQLYAFPHSKSSDAVKGNSSLLTPYDQSSPAGHLQRSPPNRRKETRVMDSLSLGMDDHPPPSGALHMARSPQYGQTYLTPEVYDEQRGLTIPITHYHDSLTSVPRGSGGGMRMCKSCHTCVMPANPTGLCRVCRTNPPSSQYRRPPLASQSMHGRYRGPPANPVTFKQMKSAYLAKCKRVSCRNQAASNTGICSECMRSESRMKSKSSTNEKYGF